MLFNFFIMADNSIQANLRKNGLKKKASERTWREWDAIYDYERARADRYQLMECAQKNKSLGYLLIWIGFGILATVLVFNYYHVDYIIGQEINRTDTKTYSQEEVEEEIEKMIEEGWTKRAMDIDLFEFNKEVLDAITKK